VNARWLGLLLGYVAVPAAVTGQGDSAAIRDVLTAEGLRFAAMEFADTVALNELIAPDLTYTDTDGVQTGRAEFLRSISSGAVKYGAIVPDAQQVRVHDSIAVVVGRGMVRAESRGQRHVFRMRYLAVYRRAAQGWQLIAWQATRVPT